MDLGAFWNAASPGINSALDSARQHQGDRMKAEHDIITGYTGPDVREDVRSQANQLLLQMAQDHVNGKYKAGSYLKNLAPWVNPQAGPPAPAGDAGAGAASAAAAPVSGAPADTSSASQPMFTGSAPASPSGDKPLATASTSPTQAGSAPMPPASPVAPGAGAGAGAAPPSPGAPPPPPIGQGPISQAMASHPATADLMKTNGFAQEIAEIADGIHASGVTPSHDAMRAQTAQQYGYSPQQLEDPKFAFTDEAGKPAIKADPRKSAAQAEYRNRLQHQQDQTGTEERGLIGQAFATKRAGAAADAAQSREDGRTKRAEAGANTRAKLERERQDRIDNRSNLNRNERSELEARREHAKAYAQADKIEAPPAKFVDRALDTKKDQDARAARAKEIRDRADEALHKSTSAAAAGPAGGPPPPPATAARAQALDARARRGGLTSLSAQEREELAGYHRNKVI